MEINAGVNLVYILFPVHHAKHTEPQWRVLRPLAFYSTIQRLIFGAFSFIFYLDKWNSI